MVERARDQLARDAAPAARGSRSGAGGSAAARPRCRAAPLPARARTPRCAGTRTPRRWPPGRAAPRAAGRASRSDPGAPPTGAATSGRTAARPRSGSGREGRRRRAGTLHRAIIEPRGAAAGQAVVNHNTKRVARFESGICATLAHQNNDPGDKAMSALPEAFLGAAANDHRRAGNARVARRPVGGDRLRGRRARPLPARAADRPGAPGRHRRAVLGQHRLRQHDPDRPGRAHAGQHRDRGAPARLHALERDGDGRQGQPPASGRRRRPRRPHLELRLAGDDVRHRLQPLLARRDGRPRRRPALHPGPLVARRLRARLHGRAAQRGAAAQLPPGGRRQGHLELSASRS